MSRERNYTAEFIKLARKKWVSNMDMARATGSYKGSTRLNEQTEFLVLKKWCGGGDCARFLQYKLVKKAG